MKLFIYEDINDGRGQIYIIMAKNLSEATDKLHTKIIAIRRDFLKEIDGDIYETPEIFFD